MSPIPKKIKDEIAGDPWYKLCCRCNSREKIEWHHTIIFASKQLQEKWSIVPVCSDCHRKVGQKREIKEFFEWVALKRATDSEIKKVSKVINYFRTLELLDKKYGNK